MAMARERLYLFDTTLRDGNQAQGVNFSAADKRLIAERLADLGIDFVEGGWPGANPTDDRFFADPPALGGRTTLTAFGMTRRPGRSVENDPGLAAVLDARTSAVCLVGKSCSRHVETAIGATPEENLAMIRDSMAAAVGRGATALYDAEHFFDGHRRDPGYAMACLEAALEGGARWVVLCDTNGGALPHEVERVVGEVAGRIGGERLGIHCHNDTENAVASTLAAVHAGARQIQGTVNGVGERCGNANLISLIPTLLLKPGFADRYEIGVDPQALPKVRQLSRLVDELLNRTPDPHRPYVGDAAFAHKGGLHVSAVVRDPSLYEHVDPALLGNSRHIVISDQAGRSNILQRLSEVGLSPDPHDRRIESLVAEVKRLEHVGYTFDGAEASFELLARRHLDHVPTFFKITRFRVMDEQRYNARGTLVTESEATVSLAVGDAIHHEVAVGNGPVNALDTAMRKALVPAYPALAEVRLEDYKVRILTDQAGTEATTRVMIASRDAQGHHWSTVGVSTNIIDASVQALRDSLTYMLLRHGAAAPAA